MKQKNTGKIIIQGKRIVTRINRRKMRQNLKRFCK